MIQVHTNKRLVRTALKRFREQYPSGREQELYRLEALGDNPSAKDIDTIIGNKSWTNYFCSACSEYVERAVTFEGDSNHVCGACLEEALDLIAGQGDKS